jgi:hypothetical protein
MYSRFGSVDPMSEQWKRSNVVNALAASWMNPRSPSA